MVESDNMNNVSSKLSSAAISVHTKVLLGACFLLLGVPLYLNLMPNNMALLLTDSNTVPYTEYGYPDLQGIWTNATITPLQRPLDLGTKRVYTEEEAMSLEVAAKRGEIERAKPLDVNRPAPKAGARIGQEADFDFYGSYSNIANYGGEYRTSLIIKPIDGRFPYVEDYLSKDHWGQQRALGLDSFDGPEGRPSGERCLDRGLLTSLARIVPYNHNYQIIQTKDYVIIHAELAHDVRIVRLNGDYSPGDFNHWHGDSVGYWEGETLVVESKNFRPEQSSGFIRMTDAITVVERFTRVAKNAIEYNYELNDPNIFTETVRVEMPLRLQPPSFRIYEYACHEGNYSMSSILAGARRAERDAL